MDAISYTAARANLAKTMDKVVEDHDAVIITRQKGGRRHDVIGGFQLLAGDCLSAAQSRECPATSQGCRRYPPRQGQATQTGQGRIARDPLSENDAWADYLYWSQTDRSMTKRIHALVKEIQRSPFDGIGKPEPLKHSLTASAPGASMRSTGYAIDGERILIAQCRHHYDQ